MDTNELYYQTGRDYLHYQETLNRTYSERAINLIGFSIAIVAAGVIALNFGADKIPFKDNFFVVSGIGSLMFLGVIGYCTSVLLPTNWQRGTSAERLRELMANEDNGEAYIFLSAGQGFQEAIKHNNKVLRRKVDAIRNALIFLALEAFCLIGLGTMIVVWRLDPSS